MVKKIGIFIPCRLNSSRLKKKLLLDLYDGKKVIEILLFNLCKSKFVDKKNIIICTTKNKIDSKLKKFIKFLGYSVFEGSEKNIIKRFYDANQYYNFDLIAEVDGDDIFTDVEILDKLIEKSLSSNYDYFYTENLPLGLNCKLFSKKGLEKVYQNIITKNNENGFMLFFLNHPYIKKKKLIIRSKIFEGRFTLDYIEDFELFNSLYEFLNKKNFFFNIKNYLTYVKKNKKLFLKSLNLNKKWILRTKSILNLKYKANNKIYKINY